MDPDLSVTTILGLPEPLGQGEDAGPMLGANNDLFIGFGCLPFSSRLGFGEGCFRYQGGS